MDTETFKKAAEYAFKNPNARSSIEFNKRMNSGAFTDQLHALGISTPIQKAKPEERTFMEKVASFTGGEKIAQGLGQALANPAIAKEQERLLNEAIEQQTQILKRKKEIEALGGDTTHIDKALKYNQENLNTISTGMEQLLNQKGLTTKQVLGDALQLATTIGSVGTYGSAAKGMSAGKLAVQGKASQAVGNLLPSALKTEAAGTLPTAVAGLKGATSFGQGALQGLKTGAKTGGILGTSGGVSSALKEDKSTEEIIASGIKGGIGGAAVGGVVGATIGGITGAIKGRQLAKPEKALEAVTPNTKNLSKAEYEKLLEQGRITPKTSTKGSQYVLSDAERETALKYQELLKTKDPVKNINNVFGEIAKQDKDVGKFLQKNNGIFNTGELKNSLAERLANIDDLTVDEARLAKLKESTINNFIKGLKKNDMETLWKSRKLFDRTIEKAFTGSPSLQNTMKIEFRNGIQEFIANRTPDGIYKTTMKEMSNLYKLKDLLETKAVAERGQSAISAWIKAHPTKAKLLGWTAGSGVIGSLGYNLLKD